MPHIDVDMGLCTGCRTCEQICVYAHEKVFGTGRARIHVLRRGVLTFEAVVCQHCETAPCIAACATEALRWQRNRVVFDADRCTGCGACVEACHAVFWDEERQQPLICDLCGACVRRCPEGAIRVARDRGSLTKGD
jgi:carbon-monoxide dehydrogenase iron sulfur subunit